jgi:hypothetical protein
VKPVQDIIGSVGKKKKKIKKKNPQKWFGTVSEVYISKKTRKRSVKPVLATIGSLNFQKKFKNPV